MGHDHILDEIRAIREAYASQFGFDQQAIYDDLKEMEQRLCSRLVQLPPRRIDPSDPRVVRRKRTA
jgi:hypothetical protein